MVEDAGTWREIDGLRLYLRAAGEGHPVVLLHGIPTSSFLWRDVLPVIALNHRAIAPDLPGFGRSDKPPERDYTVASAASAIAALLDDLGVDRIALVGHDFGALVASELLARSPERVTHLVITNTSLRAAAWSGASPLSLLRLPLIGELLMALARPWMLRLAMTIYVSRRERLDRETMRGYWEPFEHGFKRVLPRLSRCRPFTPADFARWRAALAAASMPCLLVWGCQDPTFGRVELNDLRALMPQARVQPFAHANHFLPEDRPLALGRLIGAFVAGTLRD